jgi:hypothetical protein
MSQTSNEIAYITMLLDAIVKGRITAKDARDMTPEQHEQFKQQLIAEEKAAIQHGKDLDA